MVRMVPPFRFQTIRYTLRPVGIRACSPAELADGIRRCLPESIFYHVHHCLLESHPVSPLYPNDFALWAAGALGEPRLGERLADIPPGLLWDLEGLRGALVGAVEGYGAMGLLQDLNAAPRRGAALANETRAARGRELDFLSVVGRPMAMRFLARDVDEAAGVLRRVEAPSIFYHLVATRVGGGSSDFSRWLREGGQGEAAARIDALSPLACADPERLRVRVVDILREAAR